MTRVWIRGEANILADAPSRAPWEHRLAKHLPIPDGAFSDLDRANVQSAGRMGEVCRTMLRRSSSHGLRIQMSEETNRW